ncbi:hypothetical protein V3C33_12850 [Micrococcaceae bacterium Sec5.7]
MKANGGWQLLTQLSVQGDGHVNEDACGVRWPSAWVVDGATPVLEQLGLPGASDPQWYAAQLSSLLAEHHDAGTARDVLRAALTELDSLAQTLVGDERVRFPSAAVMVATVHGGVLTFAWLADCQAVAEVADGSVVHVGTPGVDTSLTAEEHREARRLRNTPGQVWVARREADAADQAFTAELTGVTRVVLATDGGWLAVERGVCTPEQLLKAASSTQGVLDVVMRLRSEQERLGESADDTTVLAVGLRI